MIPGWLHKLLFSAFGHNARVCRCQLDILIDVTL